MLCQVRRNKLCILETLIELQNTSQIHPYEIPQHCFFARPLPCLDEPSLPSQSRSVKFAPETLSRRPRSSPTLRLLTTHRRPLVTSVNYESSIRHPTDRRALRDLSNTRSLTLSLQTKAADESCLLAEVHGQSRPQAPAKQEVKTSKLSYAHAPATDAACSQLSCGTIPRLSISSCNAGQTQKPREQEQISTNQLPPKIYKTGHGSLVIQSDGKLLIDMREGERRDGGIGQEVLLVDAHGQEVS
jgi:hypothetical protein